LHFEPAAAPFEKPQKNKKGHAWTSHAPHYTGCIDQALPQAEGFPMGARIQTNRRKKVIAGDLYQKPQTSRFIVNMKSMNSPISVIKFDRTCTDIHMHVLASSPIRMRRSSPIGMHVHPYIIITTCRPHMHAYLDVHHV
jgi:hypothetical protein